MYVFAEALITAGYGQFTNENWKTALLRWADMMPYAMYKGPTTEQVVKALREGYSDQHHRSHWHLHSSGAGTGDH
ncbi:hypothetical protein LNO88_06915 [Klebsiella pneumoniae subsp. pneumoniae]|nr:hypothetical protein [Klebsiella pneumoniae subsp. pneumoniae]